MNIVSSPEEVLATVRQAMASGDFETAEVELKGARKRWKNEPEFAVRHGNVLVKLGEHGQALKVYRKVMKKAPERLDACVGAAECAIQTGKGRLAEKLYSRSIGLGYSLDNATLGVARSLVLRSQHHLAWEKAILQFKSSGNKSQGLHEFLQEISPQTGLSVPILDQFDTDIIDEKIEGVRRDNSDPRLIENSFAAGSLEAMAGVDRDTLVEPSELLSDDLLAASSSGGTSLGIDLSALQEQSEVTPVASPDTPIVSQDSVAPPVVDIDLSTDDKTTNDDDLFDGWPDI